MSDADRRRQERLAEAAGDTDERHRRQLEREGQPQTGAGDRSIFRGLVGQWVYLESGPNFGEVGMLTDVFVDEIGRAIAVLDRSRRKDNEADGRPTGWLTEAGDGVRIPSTAVSLVQAAALRWPGWSADW